MTYLALASLLWAFSFGLIKQALAGVDPSFVAFARLALSLALFLPFLRPGATPPALRVKLAAAGAVQFGLMYLLYIRSYRFLAGHEVALFTVLTPLHVVLLDGWLAGRLRGRDLLAAALAVLGAAWMYLARPASDGLWIGFLLVQAANLCFALGQVLYRRWMGAAAPHARSFAWMYVGGAALTGVATLLGTDVAAIDLGREPILALLYLGLVPSGVGFFLWNLGATRVGAATLAVFNNVKVPLGIVVALWLFGEDADPVALAGGSALLGAALVCGQRWESGSVAGAAAPAARGRGSL